VWETGDPAWYPSYLHAQVAGTGTGAGAGATTGASEGISETVDGDKYSTFFNMTLRTATTTQHVRTEHKRPTSKTYQFLTAPRCHCPTHTHPHQPRCPRPDPLLPLGSAHAYEVRRGTGCVADRTPPAGRSGLPYTPKGGNRKC
jgi:hypothetical protein